MSDMRRSHSVVLFSGGLNSTVALWHECSIAIKDDRLVTALTIDYGQAQSREVRAAYAAIEHYQSKAVIERRNHRPVAPLAHMTIDVINIGNVMTAPSASQDINVPREEIPNQDMIMVSIAAATAVARQADRIILGIHAGHQQDPISTCEALESCIRVITGMDILVEAPFNHLAKQEIVQIGRSMNAPLALTWSCQLSRNHHCGKCPSCIERNEAFTDADVPDPTLYRP